jgi:peptide/nickel transport system ATP-binding protein
VSRRAAPKANSSAVRRAGGIPVSALLEVEDLCIDFATQGGKFHAVRSVSLQVHRGEILCLVGESGCGKSLTALGIVGLLPTGAMRRAKAIRFENDDLLVASARRIREIRGDRIGMIFQNPMTSLNPSVPIGRQVAEALRRHRSVSAAQAASQVARMLERVGIAGAAERMRQYPHQLSGGQRQRVMIAMALICDPDLIIADEPTTALDVTIQAQILALLAEMRRELGVAMVMITHDLGVVSRVADRVVVMYAGEVVEDGTVQAIFRQPMHPYTLALLAAMPVLGVTPRRQPLGAIPGSVPASPGEIQGCAFAERCRFAEARCRAGPIVMAEVGPNHRSRCVLPASMLTEQAYGKVAVARLDPCETR